MNNIYSKVVSYHTVAFLADFFFFVCFVLFCFMLQAQMVLVADGRWKLGVDGGLTIRCHIYA